MSTERGDCLEDLITELQDLRYLDWVDKKMSPGTPGCFLKAYEKKDGKCYYYKMSNFDSYRGIFGHECVNELIVSRLLRMLQIEHLEYQLIHAKIRVDDMEYEGYVCRSLNFRKENERKMAFDSYYDLNKEAKESPLEFAKRNGWEKYIYQMFVVDYLICNRDRHGANIELLIDKDNKVRIAPLFVQGLSLLFSCYDNQENIRKYNIMEDKAVNNFFGAKSVEYNLKFVPKGKKLFDGVLHEEDKKLLLDGLAGILSDLHLNKIWEMIWERWKHYAEICDSE